jgi:DnaJ family protein C protein 13
MLLLLCLQTAVGMLREVLESVHEVFVFKLVVFLLATVEKGGHDNVLRFLHGGGASVLVPLVILSLAKCCAHKHEFECDAWTADDSLLWTQQAGAVETVTVVGSNGDVRLVRIPSGRPHELLMRASELDGSLDARDAIKWQDEKVHVKIQLGIALDFLEALLRISGNNSNNGENFPPSAACCHFSREEIFCHLVQALLRAKTPIFTRILEIIITLTKANKMAMSHLYKLGAFEILLWKLLASDIVDGDKSRITKFLSQTHLLQVFLLQLAFCLILLLVTVVPLGDFFFPETFMRNPPEDLTPMPL